MFVEKIQTLIFYVNRFFKQTSGLIAFGLFNLVIFDDYLTTTKAHFMHASVQVLE